jgi:hypothetical protein
MIDLLFDETWGKTLTESIFTGFCGFVVQSILGMLISSDHSSNPDSLKVHTIYT